MKNVLYACQGRCLFGYLCLVTKANATQPTEHKENQPHAYSSICQYSVFYFFVVG